MRIAVCPEDSLGAISDIPPYKCTNFAKIKQYCLWLHSFFFLFFAVEEPFSFFYKDITMLLAHIITKKEKNISC